MEPARLEIIQEGHQQVVQLPAEGPFKIGRASDNSLVLTDRAVSKYHAQFSYNGDSWTISDLGSANGTYVDGERLFTLESRTINDGASIRLGGVYMVLRAGTGAHTSARTTLPDEEADFAEMSKVLSHDATPPLATPPPATLTLPDNTPPQVTAPPAAPRATPPPARTMTLPTAVHTPALPEASPLPIFSREVWQLRIIYRNGQQQEAALTSNIFSIGRSRENNLSLNDGLVSKQHTQLVYSQNAWHLVDQGSANGTYVNDERIPPRSTRPLSDGSIFRIGDTQLIIARQIWQLSIAYRSGRRQEIELLPIPFNIGRASDNHLVISESAVAEHHAQIVYENNEWRILDLGSERGTYVDSARLISQYPKALTTRSNIQIGSAQISLYLGSLRQEQRTEERMLAANQRNLPEPEHAEASPPLATPPSATPPPATPPRATPPSATPPRATPPASTATPPRATPPRTMAPAPQMAQHPRPVHQQQMIAKPDLRQRKKNQKGQG